MSAASLTGIHETITVSTLQYQYIAVLLLAPTFVIKQRSNVLKLCNIRQCVGVKQTWLCGLFYIVDSLKLLKI